MTESTVLDFLWDYCMVNILLTICFIQQGRLGFFTVLVWLYFYGHFDSTRPQVKLCIIHSWL